MQTLIKAFLILLCCVGCMEADAANIVIIGGGISSGCAAGNVGDDSAADSSYHNTVDTLFVTKYNSGSCGTGCVAQDLYCRMKDTNSSTREHEMVLYSDSSNEPASLLASCNGYNEASAGVDTWITCDISGSAVSISASTDYWIGRSCENSATEMYYESGSGKELAYTFKSPPASWDTGGDSDNSENVTCYFTVQ